MGSKGGTRSTSNEYGANIRETNSTVTAARERDCAIFMSAEQSPNGFNTFLYHESLERIQIKIDREIAFATLKL